MPLPLVVPPHACPWPRWYPKDLLASAVKLHDSDPSAVGSFREALADLFKSLAKQIPQIIMQAIKAALGSRGDVIPTGLGGTSADWTGDSAVRICIRRKHHRESARPGRRAWTGTIHAFHRGNITPNHRLGAAQPAPQALPVVNTTTTVINVMDPKEITGAINSSEGERVILNVLSRNRASLKTLVS